MSENSPSIRAATGNIAGLNVNACRFRERADDWQKSRSGQQWCFVGQGVNDFGSCCRRSHRGAFLQDEKEDHYLKPSIPTMG
jgi:hypothetical protein